MERKRRTFWLADTVTAQHRDRALLLTEKGFDIQFFTSLTAVVSELELKRAGVIVVSDDGDEAVTGQMIAHLMSVPEVQGARLIFVRGGTSQALNYLAACANFRDIIPFDLDEAQWLKRFLFAAGNKPMRLPRPPAQVSMNAIAAAAFPARLTWVSGRRLRLECRVRPPAGSSFNLHGGLAAAFGVPSITVNVVETQRKHMVYRFSDALVCDWTVPQAFRAQADAVVAAIKAQDPGPRCRVFVAAQSAAVRVAVSRQFADPRFEVVTALSKQSIADEPRFFSPDVCIIESAIAFEDEGTRLRALVAGTDDSATIVVLGEDLGLARLVREKLADYPGRRILHMQKLPKSITQSVVARYLHLSARRLASEEPHAFQLRPESPLSLAEVSFPARLTRLHPATAQLALPFPVGNFALCRVEAPALRKYVGRNPYGKVSAVYLDTHPDAAAFPHLVDLSLSDLGVEEQKRVAKGLTEYVAHALSGAQAAVVSLAAVAGQPRGEARLEVKAEVRTEAKPARSVEALMEAAAPAPTAPRVVEPRVVEPPAVEIRAGGARTFADMIKAEAEAPERRTPRKQKPAEGLVVILKYVAFVAFAIGLVWALTTAVAPHYEKDGSVYSEGLKAFQRQGKKP